MEQGHRYVTEPHVQRQAEDPLGLAIRGSGLGITFLKSITGRNLDMDTFFTAPVWTSMDTTVTKVTVMLAWRYLTWSLHSMEEVMTQAL